MIRIYGHDFCHVKGKISMFTKRCLSRDYNSVVIGSITLNVAKKLFACGQTMTRIQGLRQEKISRDRTDCELPSYGVGTNRYEGRYESLMGLWNNKLANG